MGKYKTEILYEDFPYEEITELLHKSYKEHLDAGRNYLAATQTIEDTRRRLEGRLCIVCYNNENKLVGTITVRLLNKEAGSRKWYEDDSFLYIEQLAVDPDYRDENVLTMMCLKALKNKAIRDVESWMSDTSQLATNLVSSYVGMGFQIVDMVSWETTNYYSYVFRKPMNGKKYSTNYVKLRFLISKLICKITYTEDGKRRF